MTAMITIIRIESVGPGEKADLIFQKHIRECRHKAEKKSAENETCLLNLTFGAALAAAGTS
jgi:hypothetical protein